MKRILALAVAAAVLTGLLVYSQMIREPLHVSGFVESDEIRLGSRVGGRVAAVLVEEGAQVRRGDKLVELEPYDLRERLAQAVAERAARRANLDKLETGFRDEEKGQAQAKVDSLAAQLKKLENGPRKQEIAAAQAQVRLANAELELSQIMYQRKKLAFEKNTITRSDMDQAETEFKVTKETSRVREEELNLLLEGSRLEDIEAAKAQWEEARQAWLLTDHGSRQEDIAAARASLESAAASAEVIERQLAELDIFSPVDGTVEAVELRPGDMVSPNAPVLSVADNSRLWVRAYVPENRLAIGVGQQVAVTVDSFPGRRFHGRISFLARQAEFTPGNVQTPEERSKQVFRIKVQFEDGLDVLRPGMSADVWLDEKPLKKQADKAADGQRGA